MRTRATARPPSVPDERLSERPAPERAWRVVGRVLVATALMVSTPDAGFAQAPVPPTSREALIRFDIQPGPLSGAIEAYALTTGMQVLYDRPKGEAQNSPGVVGLYSREAALRVLLTGAGLMPDFTQGDSVVLRPEGSKSTAPTFGPPPSDAAMLALDTLEVRGEPAIPAAQGERLDLRLYGGLVRSAVHQALRGDSELANGRYVMTLKLWIGPSGAVERLVATDSTGDRDRDLAITTVVGRVVVTAPPPQDLPQPVVLVVRSRPGA